MARPRTPLTQKLEKAFDGFPKRGQAYGKISGLTAAARLLEKRAQSLRAHNAAPAAIRVLSEQCEALRLRALGMLRTYKYQRA